MTIKITQQGSNKLVEWTDTTDAGGEATEDSPTGLFGEVVAVEVDGTDLSGTSTLDIESVVAAPLDAAGADLVEKIINHADVSTGAIIRMYPRRNASDVDGTDLVIGETAAVAAVPFVLFGHALRFTVAGGGNALLLGVKVLIKP